MRVRPVEAQILTNVLQTIGIGGEKDVSINDREDVDYTCQNLITKLVFARLLDHPSQKSRFVAAVGIENSILLEVHDIEKLLEQLKLIERAVSPKRVVLPQPISYNDHPKQVDE